MWLIFLCGSVIGIFTVIIYIVIRFIHAAENRNSYPGLDDISSWEYEKI
jgi:hypothetical protein